MHELPTYVDINHPEDPRIKVLTTRARTLAFPLTPKDLAMIQDLEAKFDQEENCAGLAAPQIGYGIRAMVFAAEEKEDIKRWRPDFTQFMPKTIWINPSYTPIGHKKHKDYEGCFSVGGMAGEVARYVKIHYKAFLTDGTPVEGKAEGFLARLIQHEIDHTDGILYKDKAIPGTMMSIDEYREKRQKAMENGRED